MRIEIQRVETGGRISFMFAALCNGSACGHISAHRLARKVGGRVVYGVDDVRVSETARRKGVGTKLYEAAANEACARRGRLASTNRLSEAHSNAFWEKQEAKGRAVRVRQPGEHAFVLTDCPASRSVDLSRFR